jgi:hypothetical protein
MYAPWVEIAMHLAQLAPGKLVKSYRAVGGTEAVEIALQVARQVTGRNHGPPRPARCPHRRCPEQHRREIPGAILEAGSREMDPDRRVLAMLSAREPSSWQRTARKDQKPAEIIMISAG